MTTRVHMKEKRLANSLRAMNAHGRVDLHEDIVLSRPNLSVLAKRARVVPEDDVIDSECVGVVFARAVLVGISVPILCFKDGVVAGDVVVAVAVVVDRVLELFGKVVNGK